MSEKDFEYKQQETDFEYEEKKQGNEVSNKVNNYFENAEKKYYKFQLRTKLNVLFSLIFIIAYIIVGVLVSFSTPYWVILLGIPVSVLTINAIFGKNKVTSILYILIVILFLLLGTFTNEWLYSSLVLLANPLIYAFKSVIYEYKRLNKKGK